MLLLLTVGLSIFISLKIRSFIFSRLVKSVSSDLFEALKYDLDSCGVAGVSENDMLKKYIAMPDRGVQRDE